MANVLGFDEVDKLFNLVMVLLGFYVLYAFQSIFDATFYGLGKTNFMLFESIVTNSVYYGGRDMPRSLQINRYNSTPLKRGCRYL